VITTATDISTFRFSTRGHPPAERFEMWHEVFGRSVSRRILSPLADEPCHVDMTVRTLALGETGGDVGARVQRMTLSGGISARRTPELLSDGNDDIVLHLHQSGRRRVSQLGREASVEPGGGLLTSNADPSTILLPDPSRFVSIGLPRKLMMPLVPGLDGALVRPIPACSAGLRLLMRYLEILEEEEALKTSELRRAAATHIQDLCALAIGATREAAEIAQGRGGRAARARAIKNDIVQHLTDGDVSPTAVARRQGVTPRYVHKLFEGEGTSLSRFVLGLRLARVHRMLSDPRYARQRIVALVYQAGFGDLSTFNREFRRCYGATPSDVRAAGGSCPPPLEKTEGVPLGSSECGPQQKRAGKTG